MSMLFALAWANSIGTKSRRHQHRKVGLLPVDGLLVTFAIRKAEGAVRQMWVALACPFAIMSLVNSFFVADHVRLACMRIVSNFAFGKESALHMSPVLPLPTRHQLIIATLMSLRSCCLHWTTVHQAQLLLLLLLTVSQLWLPAAS